MIGLSHRNFIMNKVIILTKICDDNGLVCHHEGCNRSAAYFMEEYRTGKCPKPVCDIHAQEHRARGEVTLENNIKA